MKFKNFLFLFFLISFILPNYVKSDDCKNFEDKVLNITTPEGKIVSAGEQPKYDLGLFFQQSFDYKENKIIIKRDSKNYPVLKFSLFERELKPNSSIITIDNLDLSKKNRYRNF